MSQEITEYILTKIQIEKLTQKKRKAHERCYRNPTSKNKAIKGICDNELKNLIKIHNSGFEE